MFKNNIKEYMKNFLMGLNIDLDKAEYNVCPCNGCFKRKSSPSACVCNRLQIWAKQQTRKVD